MLRIISALGFMLFFHSVGHSQGQQPLTHAQTIAAFQQELNAEYRDPQRSPLPAAARKSFQGLPFFPVNDSLLVTATFVRDSTAQPFLIRTSTNQPQPYRKYGELRFLLHGKPQRLSVYQSLALLKVPTYADYLMVPFTDLTNGFGSYGGGRYIDLRFADVKTGKVLLDFNKAYNPYCAYSTGYACPIPPAENQLSVAIRAGVMSNDH
ncbi:DUF1684 domain-containing protein [Hymenobacter sp. NBH84]|uniref:DUF1684 domain-containing protein n=1 Tax=Hymenobacter sp. NBH84 TaxID=2596915 RepID=UPI00162A79BF|nr:DUF1684 domain-containing protein [Hymenobacter sp. NBH84]QNE41516.1 DUF1684 domain-containing protein [Hymenobacter sp. NBH84]